MKKLSLLLFCLIAPFVQGDVVVVVSGNSPIEMLDESDVAGIFLAKTNRFPNGERARPIEIKESPVRELFYQRIAGKSPAQLNSYWATLVFTGKGKPPLGYDNSREMAAEFSDSSGVITYLAEDEVTDTMKVVYRLP